MSLPFTELWSTREVDENQGVALSCGKCSEREHQGASKTKEKLLTRFWKVMEVFCKELMSTLILKDEWKLLKKKKEPKMGGGENWAGVAKGKRSRQQERVYARTGRMGLRSPLEEEWKRFRLLGTLRVRRQVKLEWGAWPDLAKPRQPHSGKC